MSTVTSLQPDLDLINSPVVGELADAASRPNERVSTLTALRIVRAMESMSDEKWERLRNGIELKRVWLKHAQASKKGSRR